ncbi:sugar ABC transporter substrate-binding protein [Streptomyces sp. A7024]|uniref:Sugar ABC transporter substrate-binding protein n=1 Tax=Streptomyces coryli TaxID=1128680 RepID=A0A6G4TTX0_9ACTN|nr:sugar ABC transporter substrate-binding protein [Streptomyces coryli]NGN63222.1 sugar ABC transporter substrate-binding protein [Streptomyces coryli]
MRRTIVVAACAALGLTAGGCSGAGDTAASGGSSCDGKIDGKRTISTFYHGGGAEKKTFLKVVDSFNKSQDKVTVKVQSVPEGTYNDAVQAASASDKLPDVLDFDGPNLYNYAWNQDLIPLDDCLKAKTRKDLLPSIVQQGTYQKKLYGVGAFDSGVVLYAYKSALEKAGARIPKGVDDAWTAAEFTDILGKLQKAGYDRPLDPHMWYGRQGEWFSYAFSPIVQSAGGDLIDRDGYRTAAGALDKPEVVKAMKIFQSWYTKKYVNTEAQDDTPFLKKTSPIAWNGMWAYKNGYKKAAGDDLAVIPLPDFGTGSKTGMGSWQFGITRKAEDPDAAAAFLEYLLTKKSLLSMYGAVGAPPSTTEALEDTDIYAPGGPMSLVTDSLNKAPEVAVPRPQTPAYPTITQAFSQAVDDISQGKDVSGALKKAVDTIDQDIKDNDGYPVK